MSKPRQDPLLERIRKDIYEGNSNTELSDLDRAILGNNKVQRRGPFIPVAIEDDPNQLVWIGGREHPVHDYIATFKQTDVERFRQGFGCLKCWEEFESAFPEKCVNSWCDYQPRSRQSHDFVRVFKGDKWIGSAVNAEEETEIMRAEKHERDVAAGLVSRGVWIPEGV